MLSYVLNKSLDPNKIIADMTKLLDEKIDRQSNKEYVLKVDICEITYTTNELIPKITHEPNSH
mgnify:CR=1 FL=1|jgi:hypothetical protein